MILLNIRMTDTNSNRFYNFHIIERGNVRVHAIATALIESDYVSEIYINKLDSTKLGRSV